MYLHIHRHKLNAWGRFKQEMRRNASLHPCGTTPYPVSRRSPNHSPVKPNAAAPRAGPQPPSPPERERVPSPAAAGGPRLGATPRRGGGEARAPVGPPGGFDPELPVTEPPSPRGGAGGRRPARADRAAGPRRYLERVGLAEVHVEGRAVGQHLAAAGHRAQDVGPHLGQLCHRGPHQLAGGRQVPHRHRGGRRGPPQPPATPPGCCRRHVAVSCSAPPLPGAAANRQRRC